jgi:hypothetical protein
MTTMLARAREEVDALLAGPDLDDLVCTLLLHWHAGDGVERSYWLDQDGKRMARRLHFAPLACAFRPSTVIEDAQTIWSRMAWRHRRVSIKPGFGGHGWQATYNGRAHEAPTLPLLICRMAMLSVLEYEEEERHGQSDRAGDRHPEGAGAPGPDAQLPPDERGHHGGRCDY